MRAASIGRTDATDSAYASTASVVNPVGWTYCVRPICSRIASITEGTPWPTFTTMAPPAASRYRRPSASVIQAPSAETARGRSRVVTRGNTCVTTLKLLRVDPLGIELLPNDPKLLLRRRGCPDEVGRDPRLPCHARANLLEAHARMQGAELHPPLLLVEPVRREVGHDVRRPRARPPTGPVVVGVPAVAGGRPEMELLDERARRLPHDHEDLPRVDRDLACTAGAGEPYLRTLVGADHRRVQVAEAVDLRAAEERDVDQPGLQVEREELEHRGHGGGNRGERRIADRQRQPPGPRPEHAGLVDELELRGDGTLREVADDVRQAHADEAVADAVEEPGAGDDHQLVLREGGVVHAYIP